MQNLKIQLNEGMKALNLQAWDQLVEKFISFTRLLQKWNAAINLTSNITSEKILTHHFLDSLAVHSFLLGDRICDVGSGAGLPGIVLAITNPSLKIVLRAVLQKTIEPGDRGLQIAPDRRAAAACQELSQRKRVRLVDLGRRWGQQRGDAAADRGRLCRLTAVGQGLP